MELPEPGIEHLLLLIGPETSKLHNRQTELIMYTLTRVEMFIKKMVIIGKVAKTVNGVMLQNHKDLILKPEKPGRQVLVHVTKAGYNPEMLIVMFNLQDRISLVVPHDPQQGNGT